VDQSRDAKLATRFLETVQLPPGTALSILHVIEIPHIAVRYARQRNMLADWRKEAATSARRLIDGIAPSLRAQGLRVRPLVKEGLPGPELLNTVERTHADLAVLGPHGYSRIVRFLLGSVSECSSMKRPVQS
jgi:nucleotide-binding universal stress UspA family protein